MHSMCFTHLIIPLVLCMGLFSVLFRRTYLLTYLLTEPISQLTIDLTAKKFMPRTQQSALLISFAFLCLSHRRGLRILMNV